jgi:hypothetical protein
VKPLTFLILMQLCGASASHALLVNLDFTYDNANGGFFAANSIAKNAVLAAAADLSAAINPSLASLQTHVYTGTTGTTQATINWSLSFRHPVTGATVTLETFNFAADALTIYVGMRPLSGTLLGEGGPGGAGISVSGTGNAAQWDSALDKAELSSNTAMLRGGGPTIGRFDDALQFGTAPGNYSVAHGAAVGSLSLDSDSDNNGSADSTALLNSYWHFDHTTAVDPGKNDFYSTALHEMIHAIGIGSSLTWDSLRSGTNWLGANAAAANGGSGTGLLEQNGDHIASGKMSPRLLDGMLQEVAMDPTITTGTRKYLTELDAAFLRDIGYAAVPEPSASLLLGISAGLLGLRQRRGK